MNELDFRFWLSENGTSSKVQSDYISRLKRIERELGQCDIDDHYRTDHCEHLLKLFLNMGHNNDLKQYQPTSFPVGKYHMAAFRYALRKYVQFCDETNEAISTHK